VKALVESGIPVMAHVGLMPQSVGVLGGFRAQGRTMQEANRIIDDALSVQEAGAFAVVVECVPSIVGRAVTEALQVRKNSHFVLSVRFYAPLYMCIPEQFVRRYHRH